MLVLPQLLLPLSHTHLQCPRGKAMAQTLHPHIQLLLAEEMRNLNSLAESHSVISKPKTNLCHLEKVYSPLSRKDLCKEIFQCKNKEKSKKRTWV